MLGKNQTKVKFTVRGALPETTAAADMWWLSGFVGSAFWAEDVTETFYPGTVLERAGFWYRLNGQHSLIEIEPPAELLTRYRGTPRVGRPARAVQQTLFEGVRA